MADEASPMRPPLRWLALRDLIKSFDRSDKTRDIFSCYVIGITQSSI